MAADLVTASRRVLSAARGTVRGTAHEWYHRLAALNYERRWFSRRNRTAAGPVRCYEPFTRHRNDAMLAALDAACGPADVIVDVGANVGLYSLSLAASAPRRRVIAFEPAPAVADRFRANLELNALEDRVSLSPCALGETDGRRPFYRSSNPELSAFDRGAATRWGATVVDVRSVPVRRLDSLVGGLEQGETTGSESDGGTALEHDSTPDPAHAGPTRSGESMRIDSLPAPDVVKIDVEGAAPSVLRGARRVLESHEPTVFVEPHAAGFASYAPDETKDILSEVGYDIREHADYWYFEPS